MRIADEVGRRFQLDEPDVETLKFLVHKHLHMSHLAFRRDTSDPALIVRFAVEVGSAEVLEMLFLLTAADFAAFGPACSMRGRSTYYQLVDSARCRI